MARLSKADLPYRKVGVGAAAGALTTIAVWVLKQSGIEMPPEVAAALTTILTFAVQYMTPEEQPLLRMTKAQQRKLQRVLDSMEEEDHAVPHG